MVVGRIRPEWYIVPGAGGFSHLKSTIIDIAQAGIGEPALNRSFTSFRISARSSDAAPAPQLAEKNSSLYTWGFPESAQTSSPRRSHGAGRVHGEAVRASPVGIHLRR